MFTQEYLLDRFHYDGKNLIHCKNSGSVKKGDVAGCLDAYGYVVIRLTGKNYKAHRLIFMYVHGWCPKIIDHINRIRNDNRIENLRDAGTNGNQINITTKQRDLPRGVRWHTKQKCLYASISVQGKEKWLGNFPSVEEARAAYVAAAKKYHGEFAMV